MQTNFVEKNIKWKKQEVNGSKSNANSNKVDPLKAKYMEIFTDNIEAQK